MARKIQKKPTDARLTIKKMVATVNIFMLGIYEKGSC